MNRDVMPSIIEIESEDLKKLMAETKETIAKDINLQQLVAPKKFGIVDLWNCQRMVRTAASQRRF